MWWNEKRGHCQQEREHTVVKNTAESFHFEESFHFAESFPFVPFRWKLLCQGNTHDHTLATHEVHGACVSVR